jgi:hypothetical protein
MLRIFFFFIIKIRWLCTQNELIINLVIFNYELRIIRSRIPGAVAFRGSLCQWVYLNGVRVATDFRGLVSIGLSFSSD